LLPGTRTRSSGFCGPHTKAYSPAGSQSASAANAFVAVIASPHNTAGENNRIADATCDGGIGCARFWSTGEHLAVNPSIDLSRLRIETARIFITHCVI
jgi:hypothetical protein